MSVLKSVYEKQDEVPKGFETLFTERGGKFELTGIEGVKPELAYNNVQEALRKERGDHGKVKESYKAFADLGKTPEEIHAILDSLPQLQLAAEGKVKELTDAQKNALTAPLTRSIEKLTKDLTAATQQVQAFTAEKRQRTIDDAVRGVATEMKVLPGAVDDVLLWARAVFDVAEDGKVLVKADVQGVPAGLDAKAWLQDMQTKKAHWWPASAGGGGTGSGPGGSLGGKNPWSKDGWNLTEQGAYVRQHGEAKAKQLAGKSWAQLGHVA